MAFKVGDKIVYPMHGVGQIKQTVDKTVLGETKKYFEIVIVCDDMKVYIPVENPDQFGIRPIVTNKEIDKAYKILSGLSDGMDDDWKIRYNKNKDRVKSGSIFQVSEVVRDLFQRNIVTKELSNSEKKLYEQAHQLLVDEIALKLDSGRELVENMIAEKLEDGLRKIRAQKKKEEAESEEG